MWNFDFGKGGGVRGVCFVLVFVMDLRLEFYFGGYLEWMGGLWIARILKSRAAIIKSILNDLPETVIMIL